MAIITMGDSADLSGSLASGGPTFIDKTNPANLGGTIDSISVKFVVAGINVRVGIMIPDGNYYQSRNTHLLGNITEGSVVTISGLSLNVVAGDVLGIYWEGGYPYYSSTGGGGVMWKSSGNWLDSYVSYSTYNASGKIALTATGATSGKKWQGITISKWNSLAISKINQI